MAPASSSARVAAVLNHVRPMTSAVPVAEDVVLFESQLSSRTYVLNRAKKLNALDDAMINALRPKIEEWARGDLCKLIIGRANGRAFCAGGDVAGVVLHAEKPETRPLAVDFFKREFELDYLLAAVGKPYVVVMDGITMGGGAGLCMQAPFRIATEKTMFAMPETKIGYCPDVGASAFLGRLDGELGTYLALTSEVISGREVYELGLATHFVNSSSLPTLLRDLESLEDPSWEAIDATIEGYYFAVEELDKPKEGPHPRTESGKPQTQRPERTGTLTLPTGYHTGAIRAALDRAFAHDSVPAIFSALASLSEDPFLPLSFSGGEKEEKEREEVKKWAKRTRAALEMRSPTSLAVSLEAQRRGRRAVGRTLDVAGGLREALQMELGVATAFVNQGSPDFVTGVRAVLIDKLPKEQRPAWEPSSIEQVKVDDIQRNFFDTSSPFFKLSPTLDIPADFAERSINNPNRYSLPTEKEIERIIKGSHETSGDFGLTVEELVDKCERDLPPGSRKSRRAKGGIREKVADVVRRKCVVEEGKWVKWRG